MLRRWCIAAGGMAIVAWARSAQAQQFPGVSIRWSAPASCPGPSDLRARIRRLLPADETAAAPRPPLIADASVELLHGRYRLTLRVRRSGALVGGTRVFDSESCENLAGAAAVTLALLARGEARADAAVSSPASASSPGTPASGTAAPATSSPSTSAPPSPSARDTSAPSPPATREPAATAATPSSADFNGLEDRASAASARSGWAPALEAPVLAVDEGVLPSPAYGAGAGLGLRVRRVQLMLAGLLWQSQDTGSAALGGNYERRSGRISACYAWELGRLGAGPCATLALEDVSARGSGAQIVPSQGHATWMTLGVAGRATLSVFRWAALFVRPSVTFTTSRPTFAIDGVGPLYQVPFVSAGVDVGCEWIL